MLFGRCAAPERTDGPPTRCSRRSYREPTTFKVRPCVVLGGLTYVNVIGHPLQSARSPHDVGRRVRLDQSLGPAGTRIEVLEPAGHPSGGSHTASASESVSAANTRSGEALMNRTACQYDSSRARL